MSNNKLINNQLNKIINSQCFSKSVVLKELLKYLAEQSIQGKSPKEVEIAYEVFGKNKNRDKEKNIRIYIHNLRKKLTEYYDKEGQNDELIFSIPRGAYEVEFKNNRIIRSKARMVKASPYILFASIILLLLSVFIFSKPRHPKVLDEIIWADIFQSDLPLLVVLGDHYFVNQRNAFGNMSATRFTEINSDEDFDKMLEESPEVADQFTKTQQTYINKQAPFGLYKVMGFLGGGNVNVQMRYSSELLWEHLKENNTLFIGSYKTQGILKDIFEALGVNYLVKANKLEYTINDSILVFNPRSRDFLTREFASVIHFKTPDRRTVMALMCNTDMGNIATVKHLSDAKNLKALQKLTDKFPNQNFKAVFEVRGQREVDFELNLKRIDPITSNIADLWP